MIKTKQISCSSLVEAMDWVRGCLALTPLAPKDQRRVELCLEEALVNIFEHALQGKKAQVDLTFHLKEGKIQFKLKDKGVEFVSYSNALDAHLGDSINEREVGGLGRLFIHHFMDQVTYQREKDENILILIKIIK